MMFIPVLRCSYMSTLRYSACSIDKKKCVVSVELVSVKSLSCR